MALAAAFSAAAQTTENLVIEETNGNKTTLATSRIAGVLFEDAPSYTKAEYMLSASYATMGSNGVYTIELGTDEPDEYGQPSTVGGMQASLQLIGTPSSDKYDAVIPEGYYRVGQATNPFTININSSGLRTRTAAGEDGVSFQIFMDGTVDVRHAANGQYDIRVEMISMDQQPVNLRYRGPIVFTTSPSEYESFTGDQNVTFTGAQERYYGNWFLPLADDAMMQFYSGTFTDDGVQTEGFWLNLDTYMPKSADPMNVRTALPDGTYRIDTRTYVVNSRTYNPYTFRPGETVDFLGQIVQTGSYLTKLDDNGIRYLALIRDGEFTVSNNGKKVVFNFTDENGNKITGTYEGNIVVGNFCDNEDKEPKPPYSTLTGDRTVSFADQAAALVYKEPETFVLGYDTYELYVMDTADIPHKDAVQFTILKKEGEELGNGTYTVGTGFGENVILPGRVEFTGNVIFSWYGDNDSADDEGYQSIMAPLTGGTLTISDGPTSRTKTLTFNLTDDANLKGGASNKITGTWTGTYFIYDENDYQAPRLKRAK